LKKPTNRFRIQIVKALADFQPNRSRKKPAAADTRRARAIITQAGVVKRSLPFAHPNAALPKVDQWIEERKRKLWCISKVLEKAEARQVKDCFRKCGSCKPLFNFSTKFQAMKHLFKFL
jgi:hypothetical protein